MKQLLIVILLLINSNLVISCSCEHYVDEFCYSADSSDFIALVEIIDFEDDSAATFKLIENINKQIPDTVSVLGSDGLNCNLYLPNFAIGDTLVINANFYSNGSQNATNSNIYSWGISDCNRHYLQYSSGYVYGKLDTFNQSEINDYVVFKTNIFECNQFTLTTNQVITENVQIYPNPFYSEIYINSETLNILEVNIYGNNGESIKTKTHQENQIRINIESSSSNFYMIEIITAKGILRRRILQIN